MDNDFIACGDFVYRERTVCDAVCTEGASILDVNGKRWIDLEAANGAALFGYDSSIAQAACAEWSALASIPSFVETAPRKRYAGRLGLKISNCLSTHGRIAFDLGGAQGMELAIRLASHRHAHRRTLLVLDGCYHGRTLSMSNISSSYRYRSTLPSVGYRIARLPVPQMLASQAGIGEMQALHICKTVARQTFTSQLCGVAGSGDCDAFALLYEPVLNVAGMIDPTIEYLDYISSLARQSGAIIIADEVFTGCYRFGTFLASERQVQKPDIVVMSKALTNGMVAMSAVWGREELINPSAFPPGTYSTTFGNSPINFIVANLVMDRIEQIDGVHLRETTAFLREWCAALARSDNGEVVATAVQGLTAFVDYRTTPAREAAIARLASASESVGILVARTGMSPTRLLLHPPITLSDSEKAQAIEIAARPPR